MINKCLPNDKIKLPNKDVLLERRSRPRQRRLCFRNQLMVVTVPPPPLAEEQLPERVQVVLRVLAPQIEERRLLQIEQIVASHISRTPQYKFNYDLHSTFVIIKIAYPPRTQTPLSPARPGSLPPAHPFRALLPCG